ncbi:MAG TPA: hypothetical protein VHP11_17035, partial [Tepidisphaeraceae bacterium]|nr:hypothetical protein [Tepidisphaeraceae bacterium]
PEAKAAPVPVFSVQPIPPSSGMRVPGLSMPTAQESGAAGQAEDDEAVTRRWRRWFWIFLASYTVLLTAAYSAVPYKTPWCLLGFLHGMILLAAVGAVALIRSFAPRPAAPSARDVMIIGADKPHAAIPLINPRRDTPLVSMHSLHP